MSRLNAHVNNVDLNLFPFNSRSTYIVRNVIELEIRNVPNLH